MILGHEKDLAKEHLGPEKKGTVLNKLELLIGTAQIKSSSEANGGTKR